MTGDPTKFEDAPADQAPAGLDDTLDDLPTIEQIEKSVGLFTSDDNDQLENAAPAQSDAATADAEARARKLGWKSPDEWRGDPPPGGHKSAHEYLETNAALRRELDLVRVESREATTRSVAVAQAAMQRQLERERQEIVEYYESERLHAIRNGDAVAVDAAERARDQELAQLTPREPEPWIGELEARNNDIISNPMTAGAFQGVFRDLVRRVQAGEITGLPDKRSIVEAALNVTRHRLMGQALPAPSAQAQAVPRAPAVDAGGRGQGGAGRGFSDLPAEAKTAFKMLSKSGAYVDEAKGRADYAKDYWSQE
jgi:hypothetical protein